MAKRLLKMFLIFLGLIIFFLWGFYLLATKNYKEIPIVLSKMAKDKTGIDFGFENYHIKRLEAFPQLLVEIEDIYVLGAKPNDPRLLEVGKLKMQINPIHLIQKEYDFKNIEIIDLNFHIVTDSLGVSNKDFMQHLQDAKKANKKTSKTPEQVQLQLDRLVLKNANIDITDHYKNKYFRVNFEDGIVNEYSVGDAQILNLHSKTYFGGLAFKMANGAFLDHKETTLDIHLMMSDDSIAIHPSYIAIKSDTLGIDGYVKTKDNGFLDLNIRTEGIINKHAAALLTPNLDTVISRFDIDEPLKAHFRLFGPLKGGKKQAMFVDFAGKNTGFAYGPLSANVEQFNGQYSNHCFGLDSIGPHSECIYVDNLTGHLYDVHPLQVKGTIHDLKKLSNVEIKGQLKADIQKLNTLFKYPGTIRFKDGHADVVFDYQGDLLSIIRGKLIGQKTVNLDLDIINSIFDAYGIKVQDLDGNVKVSKDRIEFMDFVVNSDITHLIINGDIDNVAAFLGKNEQLHANLDVAFDVFDINSILNKSKEKPTNFDSTIKLLFGDKVVNSLMPLLDILTGDIHLTGKRVQKDHIFATNLTLDLALRNDGKEESIDISNFKVNVQDKLDLLAHIRIDSFENPKFYMDLDLKSALDILADISTEESDITLDKGEIDVNVNGAVYLNDVDDLKGLIKRVLFTSYLKIFDLNAYTIEGLKITDLNTDMKFTEDTLNINSIALNFQGVPLEVSGNINNFLPIIIGEKSPMNVDLLVKVQNVDLDKAIGEEQPKTKPKHKADFTQFSPREFITSLDTLYDFIDGVVQVEIDTLVSNAYPIYDISLEANVSKDCRPEKPGTHCIDIKNFRGNLFGDLPIEADIDIYDLLDPSVLVDVYADLPIADLNKLLKTDKFENATGDISFNMSLNEKLAEDFSLAKMIEESELVGDIGFHNVGLDYPDMGYAFHNIMGDIHFENEHLDIDSLFMEINGNALRIEGHCPDFVPFFFDDEDGHKFYADVKIYSPELDLGSLLHKANEAMDQAMPHESKIGQLGRIFERGEVSLITEVERLIYRDFDITDFQGNIHINHDEAELRKIQMKLADGIVNLEGGLHNISDSNPDIELDLDLRSVEAQVLHKAIKSLGSTQSNDLSQIKGRIDSEMIFVADLTEDLGLKKESVIGDLYLVVVDGEVINMEALMKKKGFLFNRRRLDDIYFDTIVSKIHVRGEHIEIDHMDINSTAATLGVDGLYSLADDGKTHLFLNLKSGNLTKKYMSKEDIRAQKERKGFPVLIEIKPKKGKLKPKIKLFKKKHAPAFFPELDADTLFEHIESGEDFGG